MSEQAIKPPKVFYAELLRRLKREARLRRELQLEIQDWQRATGKIKPYSERIGP